MIGIYLSTSSDKITVIGQSTDERFYYSRRRAALFLDAYIVNKIEECISNYEYFAVSVNSSYYYYNSSVLIVGTRNDTLLKLTVTQLVTTRVGNTNVTLIPGRIYSFVINRLQTVYLSSSADLTGTRIVTNKPVSVLSGNVYARIRNTRLGYLIEQMPPTALWGNIHYVIPFVNHRGYMLKIVASNKCVINIYCMSSSNFSN